MPGTFKNKVIGGVLVLVAGYYLVTDPVGSGHFLKQLVRGAGAFLHALHG